jgi:hypothetical protein
MSEKKRKMKKDRRMRVFEAETLAPASLRLNQGASPAREGPAEGQGGCSRGAVFSTEVIQHLIERIKAI